MWTLLVLNHRLGGHGGRGRGFGRGLERGREIEEDPEEEKHFKGSDSTESSGSFGDSDELAYSQDPKDEDSNELDYL